jgi:hypothetical protein
MIMKIRMKQEIFLRTGKRMHRVACLLATGVLVLCCCSRNPTTESPVPESLAPEPSMPEDPETPEHLEGTKWKLAGIADAETGVLEEIVPRKSTVIEEDGIVKLIDGDPIECEKCYTLTFVTDTNAYGWSIVNQLGVVFFDPIQISSTNIPFSKKPVCGGTETGESPQPTRYINTLTDLTSYVYYNNALKLFYNNNKNYLLYKSVQP